jgi:hypothetical protein
VKKFIFVLMFFSAVTLVAKDKTILAVMEIEDRTETLSEQILEAGTELLRANLGSSDDFIVIDKSRQAKALENIVKQARKESYEMCYDVNCQIPLGQALSADTILRSTVNELGGVFSLSVEMVDLAKEATVRAGNADFDGTAAGLRFAVQSCVTQLTGKSAVSGQIQLSIGDTTLKSLEKFDAVKSSVTDVNVDVLVAYDKADKLEKMANVTEIAYDVIKAWEKVVSFDTDNPYLEIAEKRLAQWREFVESRRAFEEQYQRDRGNILKILPLSVVSYDQKLEMVIQYLKVYSERYGLDDAENLLKNSEEKEIAEKILSEDKYKKEVVRIGTEMCEQKDGKSCYFLYKIKKEPEFLVQSCALEYEQACNQIKEKEEEKERLKQQKMEQAEEEKRIRDEKIAIEREKSAQRELQSAGALRKGLGATGIIVGGILAGTGGAMFTLAKKANSDGHDAYSRYMDAANSKDAQNLWNDVQSYSDKEKGFKIAGTSMLAVGGGLLLTGVILFLVESPREKEIKRKYDITFYGDPFTKTAGFVIYY